MSSERQVGILPAGNPRFPGEGSSAQGESGPKPRAKAVGDGQLVEIPVPPKAAERSGDAAGQAGRAVGRARASVERAGAGKSAPAGPRGATRREKSTEAAGSSRREKPLARP